MRMRTIDEAHAAIKKQDPHTALTKTALRRLVTTGAIPSVKIGMKFLVDLGSVEAYLRGELQPATRNPEPPQYGGIRRIGV